MNKGMVNSLYLYDILIKIRVYTKFFTSISWYDMMFMFIHFPKSSAFSLISPSIRILYYNIHIQRSQFPLKNTIQQDDHYRI